jgi:hypothetical protein|tara:strand:- start:1194 stop:1379 length:186 start_codon:yes stop_codon:yes gene_type:complete
MKDEDLKINKNMKKNKINKNKITSSVSSKLVDEKPFEEGGPKGPEPTRYGDWEKGGRCSDF